MKFTGLVAAATLFAGAFSQATGNTTAFDISGVNGTWYIEGIQTSLASALATLSQVANVSITCPQIFVAHAENSTVNNTLFVQPSLILDWYNATAQMAEKTNISMSGLMTLNSTNSTDEAVFNVSLAIPVGVKEILSSDDANFSFDQNSFTIGNESDPLPNGADYTGLIDIKLGSSNGTNKDTLLMKAYDFSAVANETAHTTHHKRDNEDDVFWAILSHENATLAAESANDFNQTVTSLGGDPHVFSKFNYTCSA